jgi:predicted phosphodiesterase
MKIAVIADAHGNHHGLEVVLNDIEMEKPDLIISAGDMINPFPDSRRAWYTLKNANIPMILGNNEDFIIKYHSEEPNDLIKKSARFRPVQYAAKLFSSTEVSEMRSLPLNRTVNGPNGDDVLICHASPYDVWRSISDEMDETMESDLMKIKANVIVAAHYHYRWNSVWRGKMLVLSGSCGFPMTGKQEVEYLILEHMNGKWGFRHKGIPYDHQSAIRYIAESDFVREAGPMGWLYMADFIFLQTHIMPFFEGFYGMRKSESYDELERLVIKYLRHAGIYETVKSILKQ